MDRWGHNTPPQKETTIECNNYRLICITQIIYKIWSKLLTARITQIMHLLTSSTKYGYKPGVSTIDAIIRIEHAIQTGPNNLEIAIMDLAKAFGCVNRRLLWATLYKKGIPITTINHIKQGHLNTTIRCKDNGKYGIPVKYNIGVFQWSALSALLFIIYLGDVMHDYQAMSDQQHLPQRATN